MPEQDVKKKGEDFQQRLAELRKSSFEEEISRLNHETERRAPDLVKSLKAKDEILYREQLRDAEEARLREEKAIAELQRTIAERLDGERERKRARRAEEARLRQDAEEQRKRQEEDGRRKADEERRKQEEALRQQREEFVRREQELRKQQEERRVVEEELRRKEAEERKRRDEERKLREEQERVEREKAERIRQEEELRLQAEEQKRQEEERRRQEEEEKRLLEEKLKSEEEEQRVTEEEKRQNRIQQLIANAERFFDGGEYDLALVEVAKALVNDPENAVALDLDARIKEILGKRPPETPAAAKKRSAPRKRPRARMRPISADDRESTPFLSRPMVRYAGAGLVVLAVILAFMFRGAVFQDHVRIAVVPFVGTSGIPEETALASAVAEEVSRRLEQADNATVLGFGSAVGIVRSEGWPTTTLFRSGFVYAVEGSFTQSDLGFSVDVRLKDSSGQILWSQRILKNPQSLVDLAGNIAEEISDKLDIDLPNAATAATFDLEAYTAYLAGLSLAHYENAESLRAACGKFQEAVERDKNLAAALADYSTTVSRLAELGTNDSVTLAMARDLADRAIQAKSSFAPAFVASASQHLLARHYVQALDDLEQAERFAPNLTSIALVRAKVYLRTGRYPDALAQLRKAYDGNPRDAQVLELLGYAQTFNRIKGLAVGFHQLASRVVADPSAYISGPLADAMILDLELAGTDRVLASLDRRLELDPADAEATYRKARMLQVSGKAREGSSVLEQLEKRLREELRLNQGNGMAMAHLAKTLTRLGRFPEATAFARKAVETSPGSPWVRYKVAQAYALQMYSPQKHKIDDKKKEEAIQALKAAVKLQYRADELANADFYNMYDQANFLGIISDSAQ